jgi:hypothetical protein
MFTAGATDLYLHKYLGSDTQGNGADLTQPAYDKLDPTNIQDLLFLENRDRKFDTTIYRLRGHYNVQNLDFDLSQFGLFLNNDVIFITIHYNDMINLVGRKLMVGDVLELPHLTDYHPLNEAIPVGLRRYYQVTDANFASEGFSQTWYPHLWRVKCEPLVDSQEFSNILSKPIEQDNYLGDWDKTVMYSPGYVVTYGDKNYTAIIDTPVGTPCSGEAWDQNKEYPIGTVITSNGITYVTSQLTPKGTPVTNTAYFTAYWQLDAADSLKDILGRYNKNIEVNTAVINEAARLLPKNGYDRSQLFVVPTFTNGQPAPPINLLQTSAGGPVRGTVQLQTNPKFKNASPVIKINGNSLKNLLDISLNDPIALKKFLQVNLETGQIAPERIDTGAGQVTGNKVLAVTPVGPITGPYGTSDNIYVFADADPTAPNFGGTINGNIDYRADCDPRFTFIARYSPAGFGYSDGYMIGDGTAPNGIPTGSGITFPSSPKLGDYFLRTDYLPNLLYRFDGSLWIRIGASNRAGVAFDENSTAPTQLGSFINNNDTLVLTDGTAVPSQQPLSSLFKLTPD